MKRKIVLLLVLFFAGGIVSLFLFGHYFLLYGVSQESLSVAPVKKQNLTLGMPVTFHLSCRGFDSQTSVSLFADVRASESVVGTFPLDGYFKEGFAYGDYLYLAANGKGIQVLDISEREKPRLLNEYLAGRSIIDIHRQGSTLYLSCGKMGVSVMSILPDGRLKHVRDIVPELTVSKTFFQDGLLYVSAGSAGLVVVDLSVLDHASAPCKITRHFSSDFAVFKHYLYAPDEKGNIEIYNITQPSHPNLLYSFETTGKIRDLLIQNQQLYLATELGVFQYTLEDPIQPVQTHHWTNFGSAKKMSAGGGHIYVSDSFSGLRIIDVDSDSAPEFVNLKVDPQIIVDVDHYLYVAGSDHGVLIVNKNDLPQQTTVKSINTGDSAHDLLLLDQWLYVADTHGGLQLKSIERDEPFRVITTQQCDSLSRWESYIFVSHGRRGIEIFDISDPSLPRSISLFPELRGFRFAVLSHYLVAAKGYLGVDLIDIQDIQHPVIVDRLDDLFPLGLTVQNDHLYVASKERGLLIFRILDNGYLEHLGQLETPFPMNHFDMSLAVQVVDDVAYIANGHSGLLIVNVADPGHPTILSSTAIPGICKDLEIVGTVAYIVSQDGGISAVDIKDSRNPVVLNTFPLQGLSRGIQVAKGNIYVAHKAMGVTVVPVPIVNRNITVSSAGEASVTLPSPAVPGAYNLQISNGNGRVVLEQVVSYH